MFVILFCIKFVLYKKLHKICLLFLSIPFMKFRSKLYFFINRKMTIINSILYRVKAEKMLLELDKLLGNSPSGICLLEYSPLLSPTFIFIHFINKLTKQGNGRVIFISLHTSAELFRVSMSKMAQRLDSDAMHFIALKEFFTNSLHIQDPMELLSRIFQEIHRQIEPGRPHLIIFDDLFFLSIPGFKSSKLFQSIVKLRTNLPQNSLILISTGDAGQLEGFTNLLFNFHIKMRPIGSGFGKNITGELEIIQRNPLLDTVPSRTILHYFCGQRSAKAFVPGSVQLLI